MEKLCRMEAAGRGIPVSQQVLPSSLLPKRMGGVINDPEAMHIGKRIQGRDITGIAIHLNWHEARNAGMRAQMFFHLRGVNAEGLRVNIGQYGFAAFPKQGRERGDVGERGGNNLLPLSPSSLRASCRAMVPFEQRGEHGHIKPLRKILFPGAGHTSALVCEPVGIEDIPYAFHVGIERRQGRPGNLHGTAGQICRFFHIGLPLLQKLRDNGKSGYLIGVPRSTRGS